MLNSILTSLVISSYKIQASLVICFINNGSEVYQLSKLRPFSQIIALTNSISLVRIINFLRGVRGFYIDQINDRENSLEIVINKCKL